MSVNAALLVAEVHKVAEAAPDHKYVAPDDGSLGCVYMDQTGQPSCIVGKALHAISPKDFALVGKKHNTLHPGSLCAEGIIDGTDDDFLWLMEAQAAQDLGIPWGPAVAQADERTKKEVPA